MTVKLESDHFPQNAPRLLVWLRECTQRWFYAICRPIKGFLPCGICGFKSINGESQLIQSGKLEPVSLLQLALCWIGQPAPLNRLLLMGPSASFYSRIWTRGEGVCVGGNQTQAYYLNFDVFPSLSVNKYPPLSKNYGGFANNWVIGGIPHSPCLE